VQNNMRMWVGVAAPVDLDDCVALEDEEGSATLEDEEDEQGSAAVADDTGSVAPDVNTDFAPCPSDTNSSCFIWTLFLWSCNIFSAILTHSVNVSGAARYVLICISLWRASLQATSTRCHSSPVCLSDVNNDSGSGIISHYNTITQHK
jgi:hypothetical protein